MPMVARGLLNPMTGVNRAGKAKSRNGPVVLLQGNKTKPTAFKEMVRAQQGDSPLPKKSLKKLNGLLQLSPAELEQEIGQMDSESLLALENLLNMPLKKLFQQLQANWPEGAIKSEAALEKSLAGIRALVLARIGALDADITENRFVALNSELNDPASNQQLTVSQADQENPDNHLAGKATKQTELNQNTPLGREHQPEIDLVNKQGQLGEEKSNQPPAEQLTVKLKGPGLAAEGTTESALAALYPRAKQANTNPNQQARPELTVQQHEWGNPLKTKERFWESSVRLINAQTEPSAQTGFRSLLQTEGDNRLTVLQNGQAQSGPGDSLSSLIGQTTNQGNEWSELHSSKMTTVRPNLSGVIEQINQRLQVIQAGQNQLDIQLEPAELGRVRVQLRLEAGELVAKLLVEDQGVKGYLEQNLSGLRSELVRQGFSIEQIQVEYNDLSPKDYNSQQEFYQQEEQPRHQLEQEEHPELAFAELAALLGEAELGELPEGLLEDYRWLNLNYYRNRMNFLA